MTGGPVFWPGLTSCGRCNTHTWSCSSVATLATSPYTQPFGVFGHDGSTSNFGAPCVAFGLPCGAAVSTTCEPSPMRSVRKAAPDHFDHFFHFPPIGRFIFMTALIVSMAVLLC